MAPSDRPVVEKVVEKDRRGSPRAAPERWQTALTYTAPNQILVRGYPLDEMMGRISFADAVYLLLMGELPTPAIGRMLNAVRLSSIDHGVTPPSTLAARNVAVSRARSGLRRRRHTGFGPHHSGDIESHAVSRRRPCARRQEVAAGSGGHIVDDCAQQHQVPPGFGHRFTRIRARPVVSDGARAGSKATSG
jgi:citrate synthase